LERELNPRGELENHVHEKDKSIKTILLKGETKILLLIK
jgi:hypothetical protein